MSVILAGVAILALILLFLLIRQQHLSDTRQKQLSKNIEKISTQKQDIELLLSRNNQLFLNASEAMFIFNQLDGSLLEVNREAERQTGYTQEEVTSLTFKVLFSREHQKNLLRMISSACKYGYADANAIKFRRKDGSQFIGDIKIRTGELNNNRIIYGSFQDTTQTTKLQQELRRHNRQLSLLNQISHRVTEGNDLRQTLEIILDEVIRSFSISGGGIFLLENNASEMKLALHRNIPDNVVNELGRIQPGMGLAGKVVETGRPRMSTNLMKDHRRISSAVFADQWKAFLAVPFIADEETLGVLFIFDRGDKVFNRDDIRLIQAIGRQLGPILKNAELFDELQWQHRLNKASILELERSRAALRENIVELEKSHRNLQNLNQMKSSFLSLASHELRTPLTTILSGAEFLQEQTNNSLGDNEQKAMEVILRGGRRLNQIVDDLLEAAQLEAKTLYIEREAINPMQLIEGLVEKYKHICSNRNLTLQLKTFPSNETIRGDAMYLERAYNRLLENAVKFTQENGCIHISGRVIKRQDVVNLKTTLEKFSEYFFDRPFADSYLEITISDTGIGLSPNDRLLIFDKFHELGDISSHSSSKSEFGGKGVGLGLTLVKGIIEIHDGLIWVESKGLNQGSQFMTLLPMIKLPEGQDVAD